MNGYIIHKAKYSPSPLPEHAGNPLIEALPPYAEASALMKTFGKFPAIADTDRKLPKAMRMLAVLRLNDYLEPLPCHFEVVEHIGNIIRSGYQFRNPSNPEYRKELAEARYKEAMNGNPVPIEESTPPTAPSFSLFGVSGLGKTLVIERTLTYFPQVIWHPEHNILQLVYIKLDCAYRANLSTFLKDFIKEASLLLDDEISCTGNIGDLLAKVRNITRDHFVGLIVLDEFQNLIGARGVGDSALINFLVEWTNKLKVPVAVLGTPRAIKFFRMKFREARRAGNLGCIIWDRAANGDEWEYFIKQLWKYQWTANMCPFSDKLPGVMYRYTQGIYALAVLLFQLSQLHAIRTGEEEVTEHTLKTVYGNKFILVHDAILALATKNDKVIGQYEDLIDKALKELQNDLDRFAQLEMLKERERNQNEQASQEIRATSALINMGFEHSDAERLVTKVFATDANLTSVDAIKMILESLGSSNAIAAVPVVGAQSKGKETATDILRSEGIIAKTRP